MSADLDYIVGRIPNYRGYGNEDVRHDTDMRVRAILGESLTDAHVRLGTELSAEEESAYQKLVFFCMFGDQRFIRAVEHAPLDEAQCAALVAADRELVELEASINAATTAAELSALVERVAARFDERMAPIVR